MNNLNPLWLLVSGNLLLVTLPGYARVQKNKPNIILILADDLGYSDPGCYGGEIATPSLDRLAKEGVRLTHMQNSAMCVCSRASLLTGNYWPRAIPDFKSTELLPEKLQKAGYRTALIGKWHQQGHPMDRGFDHFFGFLDGFADHFAGSKNYRLDRAPFTAFGPDYYSSDAFADRAIQFIQSPPSGMTDQPFFLYLSFQAPHNPLQAPRADILKYRGRYSAGWQAVREERFNRQKEMGIVPANATLPDYPANLPEWNSLSPEQRDLEDLRMSVYAAMIDRMDVAIGRVMKGLTESGKLDNTLILYMSDNGTDPFSKADKNMLKLGKLPGDPGSNWQPGTGWAYAAVTPWRMYKISQHGGGVTTGAIAWWPGKTGKQGRVEHSPIHMIDILPTISDALNLPVENGKVAGESFLPLLSGQKWKRKEPLFFQFMDNRAVRTPRWSMVEVDGAGWELFRSGEDPLETNDLAAANPQIIASLEAGWLRWWKAESGDSTYVPKSTKTGDHYDPQGDRGSGKPYVPTAMPAQLRDRYPLPQ